MRNTCGDLTASIESRRAAAFCFPTRRLALRLNELALVAVLIALSLLSRANKRTPLPSLAMLLCGIASLHHRLIFSGPAAREKDLVPLAGTQEFLAGIRFVCSHCLAAFLILDRAASLWG